MRARLNGRVRRGVAGILAIAMDWRAMIKLDTFRPPADAGRDAVRMAI